MQAGSIPAAIRDNLLDCYKNIMTRKGAYQFLAEAAEQSSENIMRTFQQSEQTTISNTNMVEIATKVATDSIVALLEKIGVLNFED